ncbi:MAG TPA: hypothetical protein VK993_08400 [Chthoniobacterales bacterium]|nr:hypothetical protein [Chthoniobacterales bacterium]
MLIYIVVTVGLACAVYLLRRHALGKVALMLFTVTLCFTALEVYYRFFYVRSDGFGRLSKNFAERYYQLDAHGLRASNLPPASDKENVVVLGDSHVFGAGLKYPTERLSEQLGMHYRHLHVINLGFSGWDTRTQTAKLVEHLGDTRARIPLVVLVYFFNDIEEDVTAADRERLIPPVAVAEPTALDRFLQGISNYSRFVELFYYRIGYPRLVRDRLDQIRTFYHDPEILRCHLDSLEQLRATARQRYSANVLVVLLPYLHSDELLNRVEFYERFNRELVTRAFQTVDMQRVFARHGTSKLIVHRFDPHTNAFANQLTAAEVIRYLDARPEVLRANSDVQPRQ